MSQCIDWDSLVKSGLCCHDVALIDVLLNGGTLIIDRFSWTNHEPFTTLEIPPMSEWKKVWKYAKQYRM